MIQRPLLTRYMELLASLVGVEDPEKDTNRKLADEPTGREYLCNRHEVPWGERGELGFDFVHYDDSGFLNDTFILGLVQFAVTEVGQVAHLGGVNRPNDPEAPTPNGSTRSQIFPFLAELADQGSQTSRDLDDIRRLPDGPEKGDALDALLSKKFPKNDQFVSPIRDLILDGETQPLADTMDSFIENFQSEWVFPC